MKIKFTFKRGVDRHSEILEHLFRVEAVGDWEAGLPVITAGVGQPQTHVSYRVDPVLL